MSDISLPDLPGAGLTLEELELYHLITAYREANGLQPIPLSASLTATAGAHAHDTLYEIWDAGLSLPDGANLHSWSDAFYYDDHRDPGVMWYAPARLGVSYPSEGFEISAAGFVDGAAALEGWKGSAPHRVVLLNQGDWARFDFSAIGVGIASDPTVDSFQGRIYHVWFGAAADPAGAPDLQGSDGADTIRGTDFADRLLAGAGADDVALGLGDDYAAGGAGADLMRGNAGRDSLHGEAGADQLRGQKGGDLLDGGTEDDNLKGGGGNDTLLGGAGRDFLNGGSRADLIDGGDGADKLIGRSFSDTLIGGAGDDRLNAGGADDVLEGGAGDDRMKGGAGADRFVFDVTELTGRDSIVDFDPAEDTLALEGLGFAALEMVQAGSHTVVSWASGEVVLRQVALDDLIAEVATAFDFL